MTFSFYPDRKSGRPVYMQLYDFLRQAIISGEIQKDEKLPSIREAADAIGLSRTTIENAYFQLLTEGYVASKSKSGYYAADLSEMDGLGSRRLPDLVQDDSEEDISREIHYFNEDVDTESFDVSAWKRIYGSVLKERKKEIFGTGAYQGEFDLRREISRFVNMTRGARTSPDQIVVGAGVQYLIGILAGLVRKEGNKAAFEDPGYEKARYIFEDYGFESEAVPVREDGIDIDYLGETDANIVYVSPSHQFPTGFLMPVRKRLELLAWAREREAFILEDDYDSLIRHESRPVPCLQGLDTNDRVIYLGSFSKILLPSLRISYMVLPRRLMEKYESVKDRYSQSASKLEQMALARFIAEGLMDKHLRRIKRSYKRKNALIQKYIEKHFEGRIEMLSADSGLNIVLGLRTEKREEEVFTVLAGKGILVKPIGRQGESLVVSLSYSGFDADMLEEMASREKTNARDWLDSFLEY